MSKGFLTFSEDEPGLTMLKDEPDDLTHLAPYAPLTDDNPFLSEMLDDFLLRDNFGPLLSEEPADPFIAYRDFPDSAASTPDLLSPNLSHKNSDGSLPSLNSPTDSLGDEDQMSTFMNLQVDDDDLAMKAPYIPMNMAEDLPLLMSDDLMWTTATTTTTTSNSSSSCHDKQQLKSGAIPDSKSSLAQLLSSSVSKHSIKATDHGGGLIRTSSGGGGGDTKTDEKTNWQIKTGKLIKEGHIGGGGGGGAKRSHSDYTSGAAAKRTRTGSDRPQQQQQHQPPPAAKMSSELLHQLMSNNHHRGRAKGKSNWLLDSGGRKAACISQPSDSVLMNLLDEPMDLEDDTPDAKLAAAAPDRLRLIAERQKQRSMLRKNSMSLLEPDATIPSLMDLTQQDYEVNAPVHSLLLGHELLSALEATSAPI